MSKHWAAMMLMVVGVASLGTACVARVDDPEAEDVDTQQALEEARFPRWRFRLNPIDPGGRLLHCLVDPRKRYISRDPDVCAGIRFYCEEGTPFFDACGCGCEVSLSRE